MPASLEAGPEVKILRKGFIKGALFRKNSEESMMKGKELSLLYTGGFGYISYISELSPLRQETCLSIHLQVSHYL